jgi:uncharacterized protein YdhG (YjbR/CyaY superfamily)
MTTAHQAFLSEFHDERKSLVEAVLKAILEACPDLSETIKWNAPTFCHEGKDRMTIMLHKKDRVGLILHTGAKPKEDKKAPRLYQDATGLLEWNSNIRATITFRDAADFSAKRNLLKKAVKRWVDETKGL